MEFEWDELKNRSNRQKHGIGFEEAIVIFKDDGRLTEVGHQVAGERRDQTIGRAQADITLLVVHTRRFKDGGRLVTRVISARPASRKERQRYDEARKNRPLQTKGPDG